MFTRAASHSHLGFISFETDAMTIMKILKALRDLPGMWIDRGSRVPARRRPLDRIILDLDFFGETDGQQAGSAYERYFSTAPSSASAGSGGCPSR